MKNSKIRVNITVDKLLLEDAKKKLHLFGGKLSTLFNAYLNDFVKSADRKFGEEAKLQGEKLKELEERVRRLEKNR
jgi:hypothetical protein